MIEIEKDFVMNATTEQRIALHADSVQELELHDMYFDTKDFDWSLQNIWLRSRNGVFELKTPVRCNQKHLTDQFHETTDQSMIRTVLNLPPSGNALLEDIQAAGFYVFCDCTTHRKKYRVGDFSIDVDDTTYVGTDFRYTTAEIELMIESEGGISQAEQRIFTFAQEYGFEPSTVRGKVGDYVHVIYPEHYQALAKAGIFKL